jgi:hypothetical protein
MNYFTRCFALLLAIHLTACRGPKAVLIAGDQATQAAPAAAAPRYTLGPDTAGRRFDHTSWGAVLAIGVKSDGTINYAALRRHEDMLNAYLVEAGDVVLDELTRHEQLALLLNVYNACTVKMILEHPRVRSVNSIPSAFRWSHTGWVINRAGVSLERLERVYIRGRFPDPRINFALVRGARGSPPLRAEPYDGRTIDEQLNDQARRVCADPRFVKWIDEKNLLRLGGLFSQQRRDFAADDAGLVRALLPWLPAEIREAITRRARINVAYEKFDWRLNGTW